MASPNRDLDRLDADTEELREVVPERAVLTELARGFLLAQHSNPGRAVRFLETFLREQTSPPGGPARVSAPPPGPPRLPARRLDPGVVDPSRLGR